MTDAQKRVLEFIVQFRDKHGYAPTVMEMKEGLNFVSPNSVSAHIANLVRDGLITRSRGKARSIVVVKKK